MEADLVYRGCGTTRRVVPREDILGRINPNNHRLIPEWVEIEERDAYDLMLHPQRVDVMAKYIYGKYRRLKIQSDWHKRLYRDHLQIMAPGYEEKDNSGKKGLEAFFDGFHEILDSVEKRGFDDGRSIIPVSHDGVIVDGAHRLAACAVSGTKVTVACLDHQPSHNYSAAFFARNGLSREWCDTVALEYCRLNRHSRVAIVWPKAVGRDDEIRAVLQSCGSIYYEKSVFLYDRGPQNIMKVAYASEPWLGEWSNGYNGAAGAASSYFDRQGTVRLFVIEVKSAAALTKAKERIRSLFGIGNYSIHINDTQEQTVLLAEALLNDNTIHFLNHATPKEPARYLGLTTLFATALERDRVDPAFFCVDGSSVMAAYGLRDARDLDLLHHGYDDFLLTLGGSIGSHNAEASHHPTTIDDIIFNPQNHFYVRGIKFASLGILRQMKQRRAEHKDRVDVRLIDSVTKIEKACPRRSKAPTRCCTERVMPAPVRSALRPIMRLVTSMGDWFRRIVV